MIKFCEKTGGRRGEWKNELFLAKQDEKSEPKAFDDGSVAAGEFLFRNRHFLPAAKYVICPVTPPKRWLSFIFEGSGFRVQGSGLRLEG